LILILTSNSAYVCYGATVGDANTVG
jgi:hypothetical protein